MEKFSVFAPARIDLAGGTLDLWPLYCFVGPSKTINAALSIGQWVHVQRTPAKAFHVQISAPEGSAILHKPLSLQDCQQLPPAVRFPAWIVSEYFAQRPVQGVGELHLRLESEIPLRSGLGGSSVLAVALVRGLSSLDGSFSDLGWQWQLLDWVRDAEAAYLGVPTGTQDYLAALFGGLSCFVNRIGSRERSGYSDDVIKGFQERLLVLFSGEMHHSGFSNWQIFQGAVEARPETLRGLRQIRAVADHFDAELQAGARSWKILGQLLDEEWQTRRETFRVETPRLDEIIGFLKTEKVLGAKVCGAAQGGSLIALVEPERKAALAERCRAAGIQVLATQPSAHALRLERTL